MAGGRRQAHGRKPRQTIAARFWERVDKNGPTMPHMQTPCWVWTGPVNNSGYGIGLMLKTRQVVAAHRVSWMIHHGDIPKGLYVLHKCDHKICVRESHLYSGTHAQNMADAWARGRFRGRKGTKAPGHKLTEDLVVEIRKAVGLGLGRTALARAYGVTAAAITAIVKRENWRHVP